MKLFAEHPDRIYLTNIILSMIIRMKQRLLSFGVLTIEFVQKVCEKLKCFIDNIPEEHDLKMILVNILCDIFGISDKTRRNDLYETTAYNYISKNKSREIYYRNYA